MPTRTTDWRTLVIQADPDWNRDARNVTEYGFSSPGRRDGDGRTHEDGQRVFRGDYRNRGPYTTDDD